MWDIATGRKVGDLTVRVRGPGLGSSISPDGSLVAGAWQEAGKVRVFPATGGEPWMIRAEYRRRHGVQPGRATASPWPSGRGVQFRSSTSTVTERCSRSQANGIRDLAWSPDGRWIAASGNPGACVRRLAPVALRFVTTGHTSWINTVAWSPDSRLLATGSEDGTARVFAVDAGRAAGSRPAGRPGPAQRGALGRLLARR